MRFLLALSVAALSLAAHAQAVPGTLANEPNPADFIKRTDTALTLGGNPQRLAGMNIPWLGLRSDTGVVADFHPPTEFEIDDALATVLAMGGSVIRVVSAGATAGCAQCLTPSAGAVNEAALRHLDLILKKSADLGLKVIIPLAGSGAGCGTKTALDPVADSPCAFSKFHDKDGAAFFTDAEVRADFTHAALAIVQRVNSLTGLAYSQDPTILAWENCDACGAGVAPDVLGTWTEALGAAIKAADPYHLYENGTLAGRLGSATAAALALPSVDILGDRVTPSAAPSSIPPDAATAADSVTKAGRVYLIDTYGWAPADWKTPDDLNGFLESVVRHTRIGGALVENLEGHAEQGGYLPDHGREAALYFPGIATRAEAADAMQARARAVRRFDYEMINLTFPAFATVNPPTILHVDHGNIYWQGAAGATDYDVERSADPHTDKSWKILCQHCATDTQVPWVDKDMPPDPIWYRLTPYNANAHAGLPSAPVQSR